MLTSSTSTISSFSLLPLPPLPPVAFLYGFTGSVFSYLFFRWLSPVLTSTCGTSTFKQHVNSLDGGRRYHYHSLLPSTIHAVVQIIGTYSFVLFHDNSEGSDLFGDGSAAVTSFDERTIVPRGITHLGPCVYMGIFVGYLVTDVACAPSFAIMGHPFVLHHVAASICWTYSACFRVMQPVGLQLQFNELSTPMMNLRQVLITAGYASDHLSVVVSSLAFFVVFGMVRVVPLPFMVHNWIFREFHDIQKAIGLGGAVFLSFFFAVNAVLQCGWFYIMCHKLVGLMTTTNKTEKKIS